MRGIWKNKTVLEYLQSIEGLKANDTLEIFSQGKGLLYSGSIADFKTFYSCWHDSKVVQKPWDILTEGGLYIECWI